MKKILSFLLLFLFLFVPFVNAAKITVSWEKPDDNRVGGYNIYYCIKGEDFKKIQVPGDENTLSYMFDDLIPGDKYQFKATSRDDNGNESDFSEVIEYTISEEPDVVDLDADKIIGPTDISINKDNILTWTTSTDDRVTGYFAYYGETEDTMQKYIVAGDNTATSFKCTEVEEGTKYVFTITAHDVNDKESVVTNILSYTTRIEPTIIDLDANKIPGPKLININDGQTTINISLP